MNARAALRETRALVNTWSRRVYRDGELVGRVHPTDHHQWVAHQWVAEIVGRLVLGIYPTERAAVRAVLDAARRG
jgi:hypothetical protein